MAERVLIGEVTNFLKIGLFRGIAMVKLEDILRVDDTVEIESGGSIIRQTITEIEAEHKRLDVSPQDGICSIKVKKPVLVGSQIYKIV